MISLVEPKIEEYAAEKSEPTSKLLQDLVKDTYKRTDLPQMLCGPVEGRFLKMLGLLTGAKRILEIGMFTGYSALSMAEALPADGELITLELDQKHIGIAKEYFEKSEHGKKIKIIEGAALDSLKTLKGPFDLCFIDADKNNYPNYYEAVLPLMRVGGVIALDNVLQGGNVINPKEENHRVMAALNDKIANDERVDRVMVPFRDGVYVLRKRG